MDKPKSILTDQQIKFHREKASQLKKEWEHRKTNGERRIQKLEAELKTELDRLQEQINGFNTKADILEGILTSKAEEHKCPP